MFEEKSTHTCTLHNKIVCFNLEIITMASALLKTIAKEGDSYLNASSETSRQKLIASATALIQELENPGEQVARIGWGEPTRNAALRTAFELGLLKKLADKPMGSQELAEGTKADPALVGKFVHDLVKSVY